MATQISSSNAPNIAGGNLTGTLAGAVTTVGVGFLAKAGYLAVAATFLGLPEATVGVVAMTVMGGLVNYGVTHFAQIKNLNDFYNALPSSTPDYSIAKNAGNKTGSQ